MSDLFVNYGVFKHYVLPLYLLRGKEHTNTINDIFLKAQAEGTWEPNVKTFRRILDTLWKGALLTGSIKGNYNNLQKIDK